LEIVGCGFFDGIYIVVYPSSSFDNSGGKKKIEDTKEEEFPNQNVTPILSTKEGVDEWNEWSRTKGEFGGKEDEEDNSARGKPISGSRGFLKRELQSRPATKTSRVQEFLRRPSVDTRALSICSGSQ
jgi:hypothetical protein